MPLGSVPLVVLNQEVQLVVAIDIVVDIPDVVEAVPTVGQAVVAGLA